MNRNRLPLLMPGLVLLAACASAPEPAPPDCSDATRFDLALNGRPVPAACSVLAPDEAYGLGEMIRERRETIERMRLRLRADPPDSDREAVRLRQRLMRAQRELPELEALARFEGWLPPAELPEGRSRP